MTIPSPCISVCRMDEATGYCLGCRRTLQEIASWPRLPDEEKKEIIHKLENRRLVPGD